MGITTAVLLISLICATQGARILGIFPMPAPSHYFLGSALMRGLAEKGHDVTMISPFGEKTPPKNGTYRDISLPDILADSKKRHADMNLFEMGEMNPFLNMGFLAYMMSDVGEAVLKEKGVQELIHSNEKFDVVIVEQFYNDAHKALAIHFDAPLIVFSTVGANFWVNPLVGTPAPPSYVPDNLTGYSGKMSFCERLTNSLIYVFNQVLHHWYLYPVHNGVIKRNFPNPPEINNVLYNVSILLLNSHSSINQPVPLVPNVVEIGGFHVKPGKKLPRDLQEFLDNATEGVVYFSMGSNLKSSDLPVEKRDAFLKAFSKLKQKVLWKWEVKSLPGKPPNVEVRDWFPQQDVLAHPNVKLFITHGGLLSTTETVYNGVPILAIPIFGDQKLNAKGAVNNGYGLTLPFKELSEEKLTEKLGKLLNDPTYQRNAQIKSKLFHDRQVSPMDTATYWVEYVIRHRGAAHLRVAGLDLPWYQYHLLDVIGVVLLGFVVAILVLRFVARKICQRFCKNKKETKVKKQ